MRITLENIAKFILKIEVEI